MSSIANSITLNDYMSSTLVHINNTMEHSIAIMQRMDLALQSLGAGALNGMGQDMAAVMAKLTALELRLDSISNRAGPTGGNNTIERLNTELTAAMTRIAVLEARLSGMNNHGGGNNLLLANLNSQLSAAQARIVALEARLNTLGSGGGGASNYLLMQMNSQITRAVAGITQLVAEMRLLNSGGGTGGSAAITALNNELAEARRRIAQLEADVQRLNNTTRQTGNSFGGWAMKLTGMFSGLQMIMMMVGSINRALTFTDTFTNANARLSLVNDGLRTQGQLQQKVLDTANATGTSYTATASLVARMGRTGQFKGDNDGAVRFADVVNKSLVISGASTAEASSVITQLSQSMSSGVLRGEEFNAVMENGSRLAEALSKELGLESGELRQMAMDGKLSAEVVAGAIMKQGEAIDQEFTKMPVTFGQNVQIMKNTIGSWLAEMAKADGALGKLNQMLSNFASWLKSAEGATFFDNIAIGMNVVILLFSAISQTAQMLLPSINEVFSAIGWAVENVISVISFLANLIFSAMPVMAGLIAITAGVFLILYGNAMLSAAATAVHTAVTRGAAIATALWSTTVAVLTTGVTMLRVALMANPIGMIITLVMMAVSVFAAWQLATHGLRQTISDVFSFIVNTVEKAINFVIEAIDGLIGSFNKIGSFVGKVLGFEYTEIKGIEYRADFSGFEEAGKGFIENVTMDSLKKDLGIGVEPPAMPEIPGANSMAAMPNVGNVDKVGKVGKIDEDVNIADEDLKYLVNLATQKYVNNINLTVQTEAPVITNNATVREEADLDRLVNGVASQIGRDRQVTVEQEF